MRTLVSVLVLLLATCCAQDEPFEDLKTPFRGSVCKLSSLSQYDFSGFRIQLQTVSLAKYAHLRLSYCRGGRPFFQDTYHPIASVYDVPWTTKMCTYNALATPASHPRCFLIARRPEYTTWPNQVPFPYSSWIGGLFECPEDEPCARENALALYPLFADNRLGFWDETPDWRHQIRRTPILYTQEPNDVLTSTLPLQWFDAIDMYENYTSPVVDIDTQWAPWAKQASATRQNKPGNLQLNDRGDGKLRRPVEYFTPPSFVNKSP